MRQGGHKRRTSHVMIVRRWIPHYRGPFYEALRSRLDAQGVKLSVVYGHPRPDDQRYGDTVDLPWGTPIGQRRLRLGRRQLMWQPGVLRLTRHADLVIVEQASSLLVNYVLLARAMVGGPAVAFWGHGRNFQAATASRLGEAVKRIVSRRAHWWFAYNDLSGRVVRDLGYPAARITSVENAIDTRALVDGRASLDAGDVERARRDLGLMGSHVGIYCGGLYEQKRLGALIESSHRIRVQIPDFELIVVGDGPQRHLIDRAARGAPWVHVLGAVHGQGRVPLFALADVFLLPGLVGLAVLDSFALEVPLVTSTTAEHSPEVDYLVDGVNGLIVDDGGDASTYAAAVVQLLNDRESLARLRAGCRAAAREHTIERMAGQFAGGIVAALQRPRD